MLLSVWQATSRTPSSPSFPSSARCLPLQFPFLPSYISSNKYTTPSSITSSHPGHLLPSLQQLAHMRHKTKHLMVHGTFKEVTHMAPLHARISPLFSCHAPTNIKMTRNFIDILTSTLLRHSLSLSPVERVQLMKCSFSSLVSKSIHLQPSSHV